MILESQRDSLEFWNSLVPPEFERIREDMKRGFIGAKMVLPTSVVVSDFVLDQHIPLYKVFELSWEATERRCINMLFLQNVASSHGREAAREELKKYYNFFWQMKRGEIKDIWPPRVFYEQGFCRRFDGKHRSCLLRYFGIKEVKCVVVTKADVLKWRSSGRNTDSLWSERERGRPIRSQENKLEVRRIRKGESRARQRQKRLKVKGKRNET